MAKVVLVSCASKKLNKRAKARDLYLSPLFKMSLEYAERLSPDHVFILSAKYGLLRPDEEIEPYNVTLNRMSSRERKVWAANVVSQLGESCDLQADHFVVLAGQKYRQYLLPYLKSYEVPLEGLSIGRQLQFLKNGLKDHLRS